MDKAVSFDLDGVKDFSFGVFFKDELEAAIESGESLEAGIGLSGEGEAGGEVVLHLMAFAPSTASSANEGFAVEEGDGVVVGKDTEGAVGIAFEPMNEFVFVAQRGVVGVIAV